MSSARRVPDQDWHDCIAVQRDQLVAIAELTGENGQPPSGAMLSERVGDWYGCGQLGPGRTYDNLHALADAGLVEKRGEGTYRNEMAYALTEAGAAVVREQSERLRTVVEGER